MEPDEVTTIKNECAHCDAEIHLVPSGNTFKWVSGNDDDEYCGDQDFPTRTHHPRYATTTP